MIIYQKRFIIAVIKFSLFTVLVVSSLSGCGSSEHNSNIGTNKQTFQQKAEEEKRVQEKITLQAKAEQDKAISEAVETAKKNSLNGVGQVNEEYVGFVAKKAIEDLNNKISTISVNNGDIAIEYNYGQFWGNENRLYHHTCNRNVKFMSYMFKNKDVSRVTVTALVSFVDQYGQESIQPATRFTMVRSTANKINWQNFNNLVKDNSKYLLNVTDYYIHPTILKHVKI